MSYLISWIDSSRGFFQHLGWVGILLYAAMFILAQALLVPVAPLAIGSGVIFGFVGGLITTTLGTAGGLILNFIIARHFARDAVMHRLGKSEKFRLIDAAIGREGWKIVCLLRFCPLPFGISNFAYGLTAIPFTPYCITSILAIVPANTFFVWLGSSTQESMQALVGGGRPRHPFEYVMMGLGLVGGFVALAFIGRIAHAAVTKADAAAKAGGEGGAVPS